MKKGKGHSGTERVHSNWTNLGRLSGSGDLYMLLTQLFGQKLKDF